ncbi:MAG: formylglycine-generating enzyme family protein [Trueperaceae bacterium]|nr:formylglycine-generating enzyme family protein [Trueperaceae bacterium]
MTIDRSQDLENRPPEVGSVRNVPCCGPGSRAGDAVARLLVQQSASTRTTAGPVGAPHAVIDLPGGTFRMGTDAPTFPQDREGPVRSVHVEGFSIDAYAVTNARFAAFVDGTSYVTEAERFGWSFVFYRFLPPELSHARPVPGVPWWRAVLGATWCAPEGPGSDLAGRADHPVVHVSWRDARAFATWAGGRLAREAEWEYAARGGLEGRRFPWGDELERGGRHRCNVWQGTFPERDTGEDGFVGTAPVDAFEPNGFGLYNVVGNVWEWCEDRFDGARPEGPGPRVQRGGSYLCHASYCDRYRVSARTPSDEDSSTGHLGFRLAYDRSDGSGSDAATAR